MATLETPSSTTADFQAAPSPRAPWGVGLKILFRFVFSYLALYLIDEVGFLTSLVPGTSFISEAESKFWQTLIPWVGKHILHLATDITVFPSGSGDTTFNYVQLLVFVVFAAIATVVWSILDRKREEYHTLHEWLRIVVRYMLAAIMMVYGMVKVIKLQFPAPYLTRLVEPYGESSPMALLWTFMGYSAAYTFFAGASEVVAGLLLFFRRTTTLGALVTAGVVSNIVMLNYSYDVPVKLFSSHLLLMALFLLTPDVNRLLNFLVLNRATAPQDLTPPFGVEGRLRWVRFGLKTIFIGLVLYTNISGPLEQRKEYGSLAPKPELYGVWDVTEFRRNGEVVPPLTTDSSRWRKVIMDSLRSRNAFVVRSMDDKVTRYALDFDPQKKTLSISPQEDKNAKDVLRYTRPDRDRLILEGTLGKQPVTLTLQRYDESKFLLLNRGFHWINEVPYNR